jgi:hypothetical protein
LITRYSESIVSVIGKKGKAKKAKRKTFDERRLLNTNSRWTVPGKNIDGLCDYRRGS